MLVAVAGMLALQARAATYYVIVAGLGGEPDYVQRFTAAANDLDRTFKAEGPAAHVDTLTGAQSTAADLRETLSAVARDAKAGRRFRAHSHRPRLLRRRGIQVQPGGAGHDCGRDCRVVRPHRLASPAGCGHIQRQRRRGASLRAAGTRRHRSHQIRHRKKRDSLCALLG